MTASVRCRLRIIGRVQGVSFRWYARRQAQSLGLTGWARNCPDGSVEVVVQGDQDLVRQFVGWAHRGPSMAQVQNVDVSTEEPEPTLTGFRILG